MLGHATASLYGHLFDNDLTGVAGALSMAIRSTAVSLLYESQQTSEGELLKVAS
jgi:hypothetical protein